jgi:hypothetical protein
MDLFERLKRATAEIPWETFASVMAQNLGASSTAAQEVAEQLKEWGSHLTKNALSKWTFAVMSPTPCASPDVSTGRPRACRSYAVVKCDVCGRPCCLAHSRVDYMADAICEVCIGETKARKRAEGWTNGRQESPPPPAQQAPGGMSVAMALKALKMPPRSNWEQIKRQYRKLVLKYNADRPQSDRQRALNVERLKKFNVAYEVLRREYEQKAAA